MNLAWVGRVTILPLAALVLTACAWTPTQHQTPTLASSAPVNPAVSSTMAPGSWPDTDWWQRYDDATLNELVTRALRDSPSLLQVQARFDVAVKTVRINAASSGLRVTADADASRQRLSDNGLFNPDFLGFNWYTSADLGIRASYHFDWWHQRRHLVNAALFSARAAQAERQAARISLSGAVVSSYLGWQADQEQLANLDAQIAVLDQQQHINALRHQAQLDNADPGLQLQAQRATLSRLKVQWQYSAQLRRVLLASLIGSNEADLPAFERHSFAVPDPSLPEQLTVNLLARRAEIASAYWRVKASEQQLGVARAAFMPDISVNALAGLSSIETSKLLNYGSRVPSLGLALHLPLFDSGLLRAQYGAQAAQLDAAVAGYNQTVIEAARDVATAALQFNQLAAEQQQHTTQQAALDALWQASKQRQQQGLTDARPALNAQLAALQQQAAVSVLQAAQRQADLKLQLALGGGYLTNTSADTSGGELPDSSISEAAASTAASTAAPNTTKRHESAP